MLQRDETQVQVVNVGGNSNRLEEAGRLLLCHVAVGKDHFPNFVESFDKDICRNSTQVQERKVKILELGKLGHSYEKLQALGTVNAGVRHFKLG